MARAVRLLLRLFAMPLNDDQLPVRRHRVSHTEIYEVSEDELERIEHECANVGTDLQFATFWLSVAITSTCALPSIPETSIHAYNAFFIVMIISYGFGLFFSVRWWIQRGRFKKLIQKIRDRQVGPIGSEGHEIKQGELEKLPSSEPDVAR